MKYLLVLPVSLAALAFALPSSAGAYLYWSGNGGGIDVVRADLSGGELNDHFVSNPYSLSLGGPDIVALGGRYIYFSTNVGVVGRANLSGGGVIPDLFTVPQAPPGSPHFGNAIDARSLAVGERYIYWSSGDGSAGEEVANGDQGEMQATDPAEESIGRARVGGDGIQPNFIQVGAPVYLVRVDAGHIYWVTQRGIGRANIHGGDIEPNFIAQRGIYNLAVAEGHIYWTTAHAIERANLEGREVRQFITGLAAANLAHVLDVAVGAGYIYWDTGVNISPNMRETELAGSLPRWIGRASIDGSEVRQNFISVTNKTASSLVVDALGPGAAHQSRHDKHRHRH